MTQARGAMQYSRLGEIARRSETVITRLMGDALADPELLSLAAGFTDNRVLPLKMIQSIVAEMGDEGGREQLQYGMNRGRPGLIEATLQWMRTYPGEAEIELDPSNVLVTNGSQQGLYLLTQAICEPGDIVLVEDPTYFVYLELLRGMGIRAMALPSDSKGRFDFAACSALLDELESSGEFKRIRAVYVMGTFANPSTRSMALQTKLDLADFMRRRLRGIPIIEDMAYRDLYFEEPHPVPSLLSIPEWRDMPVVYAGTFTKPFATGLKVGFMATRERELLEVMGRIKGHQDFGTAHFNQAILQVALETGRYAHHLQSVRSHYLAKAVLLEQSLLDHGLRDCGWSWERPSGGLLLWAQAPEGVDTRIGSAFHRASLKNKVLYVPGDLCFASGGPWDFVRLSFGALSMEQIPEAARRFCATVRECF